MKKPVSVVSTILSFPQRLMMRMAVSCVVDVRALQGVPAGQHEDRPAEAPQLPDERASFRGRQLVLVARGLAYAWLLMSGLMLVVFSIVTLRGAGLDHAYVGAYRQALTVGFITTMRAHGG